MCIYVIIIKCYRFYMFHYFDKMLNQHYIN